MDYPMTKDMTIGEYLKSLPDKEVNGACAELADIILDDMETSGILGELEGTHDWDDVYDAICVGEYDDCLAENFFEAQM